MATALPILSQAVFARTLPCLIIVVSGPTKLIARILPYIINVVFGSNSKETSVPH